MLVSILGCGFFFSFVHIFLKKYFIVLLHFSIQKAATTPIHKGIESDYLNENENEADEISENGDNFLYEARANTEKVMYLNLETPVLDDNNEFMEVDQRQCHGAEQSQSHCCKRGFRKCSDNTANFTVTKPKRLSDEFNDDISNKNELVCVFPFHFIPFLFHFILCT